MTSLDHDVHNAKDRLSANLATPRLRDAVALYFDPDRPFAGQLFDSLGRNPTDMITSDDLLAVTLLDVRWTPLAVRRLLTDQDAKVGEMLGKIDNSTDLWADDGTDHSMLSTYCGICCAPFRGSVTLGRASC